VRGAAAHQRVLHHDAAGADFDEAVLGAEDRAEEHARLGPDATSPQSTAFGAT
jgi:hypothetical protein